MENAVVVLVVMPACSSLDATSIQALFAGATFQTLRARRTGDSALLLQRIAPCRRRSLYSRRRSRSRSNTSLIAIAYDRRAVLDGVKIFVLRGRLGKGGRCRCWIVREVRHSSIRVRTVSSSRLRVARSRHSAVRRLLLRHGEGGARADLKVK